MTKKNAKKSNKNGSARAGLPGDAVSPIPGVSQARINAAIFGLGKAVAQFERVIPELREVGIEIDPPTLTLRECLRRAGIAGRRIEAVLPALEGGALLHEVLTPREQRKVWVFTEKCVQSALGSRPRR